MVERRMTVPAFLMKLEARSQTLRAMLERVGGQFLYGMMKGPRDPRKQLGLLRIQK